MKRYWLAGRVFGFGLALAGVAAAAEMPRYQLQVGQQFVFHCDRTEVRAGRGASTAVRHIDWKVDVVGRNSDGSWHVVDMVDSGGTIHEDNATIPYERVVEAGDCDLSADGMMRGDDDPLVNLSRLFPRLPGDEKEMGSGWEDQSVDHSRWVKFSAVKSDGAGESLSFVATTAGGIPAVFEPGAVQTYQFNRRSGVVDEIRLGVAGADPNYTEQGEIRRVATNQLDAATMKKISEASSAYETALAHYRKDITSGVEGDGLKAEQGNLQETAKAFIACTFFDGGADNGTLKDGVNGMVSDLPTQHDFLDAPAPDWTAKDVEGNEHSLKDLRGKVALLDFGSRGCTWCIREMPQLIRLSEDFKGRPVAIVGMDLDTEAADVKFVTNALRPPYLTLLASDAAKGYPVQGTPTVVIVDQNGVMRRRIIGYTTSGYEEMKGAIEAVLEGKIK